MDTVSKTEVISYASDSKGFSKRLAVEGKAETIKESKREEVKDSATFTKVNSKAIDSIHMQSLANSIGTKQNSQSIDYRVDLCFLIDGTSSMQPWIDATKGRVNEIIKEAQRHHSQCTFRIAIVVYRDFDMKQKSIEIQPFTEDPKLIEDFLRTVIAVGGGDGPEDVNGGLQQVLSHLKWQSSTRVLVHFADAPCHGPDFHNLEDHYPSPSSDIEWKELFLKMQTMGIDYNFIEFHKTTEKMTSKFDEIWQECFNSVSRSKRVEFNVYPMSTDPAELVTKIKTSVVNSVNRSFKQMNTAEIVNAAFNRAGHAEMMKKLSRKFG